MESCRGSPELFSLIQASTGRLRTPHNKPPRLLSACSKIDVEIAVNTIGRCRIRYLHSGGAAFDARAQVLLADNPDFQRLLTLPGIGAVMALTILAEAGDLRRFSHHRQFLK